jgi:glycosyltransferase involved in cell wall biosynthesis
MIVKGLLICNYPFPQGMAATNRILAYSEGLAANGVALDILTKVACNSNKAHHRLDRFRSIYSSTKYNENGSYFKRNFWDLRFQNIKFGYLVWKLGKRKDVSFILFSFDNPYLIWLLLPITLFIGKPVGFASDEFPPSIRARKKRITYFEFFTYKFFHSFLKFRLLMSNALVEYYNSEFSNKPDNLILNTIVSIDFVKACQACFISDDSFFNSKIVLVYMGNMELAKDNVDNIIKAISLLNKEFPGIQLHLYGEPKPDDLEIINSLISRLELMNNIFLKGKVFRDRIPKILSEASLLVSSQPNSFRAKGGFPTKLGEYWASSRPVLFTDVGELSLFIKDGFNGFLVVPDNPKEYALKTKFILNNMNLGTLVGRNGYNELISRYVSQEVTRHIASYIISNISNEFQYE